MKTTTLGSALFLLLTGIPTATVVEAAVHGARLRGVLPQRVSAQYRIDYHKPRALLFNLRMDPFEKHDGWKSQEIAMKLGIAWGGQVQDAFAAHLKSLEEFSPRQKGGTLTPRP